MNRIKLSPLATGESAESKSFSGSIAEKPRPLQQTEPESRSTAVPAAATPFSFFVPLHYEKHYAYPLIVWLHSDGQSAKEIQAAMLGLSLRNYVGVAPESPRVTPNEKTNTNEETNSNEKAEPATGSWIQKSGSIEVAHESVAAAIDMARQRFNIAAQRIFLAGIGSGGTMAFRLAFEQPDLFAGVLSVGGPLPEAAPLRAWNRCRELPVFWAHSRCGEEFDEAQLCHQLRLLHIAGFSVTVRQYPQANLVCPKTMSDMNGWIMETTTGRNQ
jgi:phospholipase/carboxylesterase